MGRTKRAWQTRTAASKCKARAAAILRAYKTWRNHMCDFDLLRRLMLDRALKYIWRYAHTLHVIIWTDIFSSPQDTTTNYSETRTGPIKYDWQKLHSGSIPDLSSKATCPEDHLDAKYWRSSWRFLALRQPVLSSSPNPSRKVLKIILTISHEGTIIPQAHGKKIRQVEIQTIK